jgi:hypothetical protein
MSLFRPEAHYLSHCAQAGAVEAGGGKLGLVSQQVAGLVNRGGGNGAGTFQAGLSQEIFFR